MPLTRELALQLQRETPHELASRALSERDEFVFSVRDSREREGVTWGGEFRLCINRNLVLHFTPGFNEEMRNLTELPQFAIMPDEERDGHDEVHMYEGTEELEPFEGVIFWVGGQQYEGMVCEIMALAGAFEPRTLLPDVLCGNSHFVRFVTDRVLDNGVVRKERKFDFTKSSF
ncbi:hypothetical protein ACFL59_15150 [Planctomycetota bacterium]